MSIVGTAKPTPLRRRVVVGLFAVYVAYLIAMSSDDRDAVSYLHGNRLSTPNWCMEGQNRCVGHMEQRVGVEWTVATVTLSCGLTQRLGMGDHGDVGEVAALLPPGDVLLVMGSTCSPEPADNETTRVASHTLACVRLYQSLRRLGTWRDIRFVDAVAYVVAAEGGQRATAPASVLRCDGHYERMLEYPFASDPGELARWMMLVDDPTDLHTPSMNDGDRSILRNLRVLAHASSEAAVGGLAVSRPSISVRGPSESLRAALVPRNRLLDVVTSMADKERLWTLNPLALQARISHAFQQEEPMPLSNLVFLGEDVLYLPFPIDAPAFKALMVRLFDGIPEGALRNDNDAEHTGRAAVVSLLHVLADKNIAPTLLLFPCGPNEAQAFGSNEIEWRTHPFSLSSLERRYGRLSRDDDRVLRRTTAVCLPPPFQGDDDTAVMKAALWDVHTSSMDVVRRP